MLCFPLCERGTLIQAALWQMAGVALSPSALLSALSQVDLALDQAFATERDSDISLPGSNGGERGNVVQISASSHHFFPLLDARWR